MIVRNSANQKPAHSCLVCMIVSEQHLEMLWSIFTCIASDTGRYLLRAKYVLGTYATFWESLLWIICSWICQFYILYYFCWSHVLPKQDLFIWHEKEKSRQTYRHFNRNRTLLPKSKIWLSFFCNFLTKIFTTDRMVWQHSKMNLFQTSNRLHTT